MLGIVGAKEIDLGTEQQGREVASQTTTQLLAFSVLSIHNIFAIPFLGLQHERKANIGKVKETGWTIYFDLPPLS